MLPGISMMTPSDRLIERRRAPAELGHRADEERAFLAAGRTLRRSLMICGALAMTSCGNMHAVDRARAHALGERLRFIVRFRPSSPPTPSSVKPKPSWMPGSNSTLMIDDEQREALATRPASSW